MLRESWFKNVVNGLVRLQEENEKKAAEDLQKSLAERGGVATTFTCDGLMDFDADVFICGSLTGGKLVREFFHEIHFIF